MTNRFWVTERRVFQEKLGDEQRMAQDQAAADARLADLEGQVRQVRKCGKCGRCEKRGRCVPRRFGAGHCC